ncbi:vomeronasal type-1 receptor 4-like [Psammomys obesus]|uniref:vomeronasal type-1 receptor 4-like n=1 Tax=Psammomys obesus TaxID=48139 RepID=UPI002452AAA2|nr:vomeronasal type-1 receptor 4-like [Psammomys obesus]
MFPQNDALATTEEVALQILLLCLVGIGTAANILLFVHNFSPVLTGSPQRPTQVVLTFMAVANALILLITAFPNNMFFVPRKPQTDLKCKWEYYTRMVVRSTNLCSTCVLSTYQYVTLVPGKYGRVILRGRAPKVLKFSCYGCWFFSLLNNVYVPMTVSGPQNISKDYKRKWACSTSGFSLGIIILQSAHHAMFISIMVWTSVSMVILLHRHHQKLHHIHTCSEDQRAAPESRAAHTILMLVAMFVSFYVLDCIYIYLHVSYVNSRLWLRHVGEVFTAGFPTISPLLLIFRDPKDPCSVIFKC